MWMYLRLLRVAGIESEGADGCALVEGLLEGVEGDCSFTASNLETWRLWIGGIYIIKISFVKKHTTI